MRPVRLKKSIIWMVAGVVGAAAVIVLVVRLRHWRPRSITLQGAAIRLDADPRKEIPIANATVVASDGTSRAVTLSSASGYFRITVHNRIWPATTVQLAFSAPGYQSLDMVLRIGLRTDLRKLYIAQMKPLAVPARPDVRRPTVLVSDIRIRYTINYQTDTNIGSAVKTFQVVNTGNLPCAGSGPCSPDGMWKAASGSATLDAGAGNVFRNVRASCIAGPCPFTQIDARDSAGGGQIVVATATDWSQTATFLVEAEVFHTTIASSVRESYPVKYGRDLHFTLPPTAEGPSIEADIDGAPIVFPLGGDLYLSWANCSSRTDSQTDNSAIYQCVLKPGYRF